jgi:hypothetical protein
MPDGQCLPCLHDQLQGGRDSHQPGRNERQQRGGSRRDGGHIHKVHAKHAQRQPGEARMEERQLYTPQAAASLTGTNAESNTEISGSG